MTSAHRDIARPAAPQGSSTSLNTTPAAEVVTSSGQTSTTTTLVADSTVLSVLRATAAFFRATLEDPEQGRRARRALARRRLPLLAPEDGTGVTPQGWTTLTDHLHTEGFTDDELLAADVSQADRNGRLIDRFRDRITFAIHNEHQDVVGFTARAFDEDRDDNPELPKYLNSRTTSVYRKSGILYGFTPAARAMLAAGALPVVVEGPTDAQAITLAGGGRFVGVATCGTALTTQHLDFLEAVLTMLRPKMSARVDEAATAELTRLRAQGLAVAFDPDTAGRAAARRAWNLTTSRGLRPLEVVLPEGADPASLRRTKLTEVLEETEAPLTLSLIHDAVLPFAGRLHEDPSQLQAVRAAVRLIHPEHDDPDLGRCLAAVAAATKADMTCVVEELLNHRGSTTSPAIPPPAA